MIDGLKIEQIPSLMEGLFVFFKTGYFLSALNKYVKLMRFLLTAFTGWDTNNKYAIRNKSNQQVYYAMEVIIVIFELNLIQIKEFFLNFFKH